MRKSFTRLLGLLMLFCFMSFSAVSANSVPAGVEALTPADGFFNVEPKADGTVFTIKFEKAVKPGYITYGDGTKLYSGIVSLVSKFGDQLDPIQVVEKGADGIIGRSQQTGSTIAISEDGKTVTITFKGTGSKGLKEETDYFITVSNKAFMYADGTFFQGILGDPANWGNSDWNFRCGDFTNPQLVLENNKRKLSPLDQAKGVLVNSPLVMTFNESIKKGTGHIGIYTANGAIVELIPVSSAQIVISNTIFAGVETGTVTITPSQPLNGLTEYYIRVPETAFKDDQSNYGSTAVDLYFSGINTNTGWNFLTIDTEAPKASFKPAADVKVAQKQVFEINFTDNRSTVEFDPKDTKEKLVFNLFYKKADNTWAACTNGQELADDYIKLYQTNGGIKSPIAKSDFTAIFNSAENKIVVTPKIAFVTGAEIEIEIVAGKFSDNDKYALVQNADGTAITQKWTAGDFTVPTFASVAMERGYTSTDKATAKLTVKLADANLNGLAASLPGSVKVLRKLSSESSPSADDVWNNGTSLTYNTSSTDYTFTDKQLASKTAYKYYFVAEDKATNRTGVSSAYLFESTDYEAPKYTIAYTKDADNIEKELADKNAVITLTFNEEIFGNASGGAVNLNTAFKFVDSKNVDVPYTAAFDGANTKKVIITPSGAGAYALLKDGETYKISVANNSIWDNPSGDGFYTQTISGSKGTATPISSDAVTTFTVEDYTGPIPTFAPADGTPDVSATNASISVSFKEDIFSESGLDLVNDSTKVNWVGYYFFLREQGLGGRNLSVNQNDVTISGRVVTFRTRILESESPYYVHVSDSLQDKFGIKVCKYEDGTSTGENYWASWTTSDRIAPLVDILFAKSDYTDLAKIEVESPKYIKFKINEGLYFNSVAVANFVTDNNRLRPQIELFEGSANGTPVEFNIVSVVADADKADGSDKTFVYIEPINGFKAATSYFVRIKGLTDINANLITDADGNLSETLSTKDTTPPTLTAFSPNKDGADVDVNTDVKLEMAFSTTVDQVNYLAPGNTGISLRLVNINDATDNHAYTFQSLAASGNLAFSSEKVTVTLVPSEFQLQANTSYSVTIDPGAFKNQKGNVYGGLLDATKWIFNTEDDIVPTYTVLPGDGTTGHPVNSKINLTFSEPIKKGLGTILLHRTSGSSTGVLNIPVSDSRVSVVNNETTGSYTVTINPNYTFAYGTNLSLEIPKGAFLDLSGNEAAATGGTPAYTFTIVSDNAPKITWFKPTSDNVKLDSVLTIKFSELVSLSTDPLKKINIKETAAGSGTAEVIETVFLSTAIADGVATINDADSTITFNLKKNFISNANYEVVVDAGSFVERNVTLASAQSTAAIDGGAWTFTTSDNTIPGGVWSVKNGDRVAVNSKFTFTFDEDVKLLNGDALTGANVVSSGLFTLGVASPTISSAVVNGRSVTLTLSGDLTSLGNYTLSLVSNKVKDASASANENNAIAVTFDVEDKTKPIVTVFSANTYFGDSIKFNVNLQEDVIAPNKVSKVYLLAVKAGAGAFEPDPKLADFSNGKVFDFTNGTGPVAFTYTGLEQYTAYNFYAWAIDGYGNTAASVVSLTNVYTLDKTAPIVKSVKPADDLQNVNPKAAYLEIEFSEDVVLAAGVDPVNGVNLGTGKVYGITLREMTSQEQIPVSSYTVSGKKITLTVGQDLAENKEYYVEIDYKTVLDNPTLTLGAPYNQDRNYFAEAYIGKSKWNFKTGEVTGLNLDYFATGTNAGKAILTPLHEGTSEKLIAQPSVLANNLTLTFDEPVALTDTIIYIYRRDVPTTTPHEWLRVKKNATSADDVYVDPSNNKKVIIKRYNNYTSNALYSVVIPQGAIVDQAKTVKVDGTLEGPNKFKGFVQYNGTTLTNGTNTANSWIFKAIDVIRPTATIASVVSNKDEVPVSSNLVPAAPSTNYIKERVRAKYPTVDSNGIDARTLTVEFMKDGETVDMYSSATATAEIRNGIDLKDNFLFKETVGDTAFTAFTAKYDSISNKVTIVPTKDFKSNTSYTVSIKDNKFYDKVGNALASTTPFVFKTWDETPVDILFSISKIGVDGKATEGKVNAATANQIVVKDTVFNSYLNTDIFVTFSEKVVISDVSANPINNNMDFDPTKVDATKYFTLTKGGVPVPFTVTAEEVGRKYKINPTADFVSSNGTSLEIYEVAVVADKLKDLQFAPNGNVVRSYKEAHSNTSSLRADKSVVYTKLNAKIATQDTIVPVLLTKAPTLTISDRKAKLVMTFNELVKAGTGTIQIRKAANGQLFQSINVNNAALVTFSTDATKRTVTIDHDSLDKFTQYYITVDNGAITDLSGNVYKGFSDNKTWKLSTDDGIPPVVVEYSPKQGAKNVETESNLVLTFSENIKLLDGTKTVTVFFNNVEGNNDGNTIEVISLGDATKVNINKNVLTINPDSTFNKVGTYYVRIDSLGIGDFALPSNDYAGIYDNNTWKFTTTDNTKPSLIEFTPAMSSVVDSGIDSLTMKFDVKIQKGIGNIYLYQYNYKQNNVNDEVLVETIDILSSRVSISEDSLSVKVLLTEKLRDNINFYYVLVDSTTITNQASSKDNFRGVGLFDWMFKTAPDKVAPKLAGSLIDAVGPINETCLDKGVLKLTMKFTEPVMFGEGNIVIKKREGNVVVETISAPDTISVNQTNKVSFANGDSTIIITPKDLKDLTEYYVVIEDKAIKDRSSASVGDVPVMYDQTATGNFFAGSSIAAGDWKFTTGDVEAPVLDLTKSTPNGDNVVDADQIVLTFDEVVIPVAEGKTAGKVIVTKVGATEEYFSAVITEEMIANNVVTIPVGKAFDNTTDFVVTVEANAVTDTPGDCDSILGVRGNVEYTWNFSTDAAPFVTADPMSSAAALDTFEVVLTFSEVVATVDAATVLVAGGSIVNDTIVDNLDNTYTLMLTGNDGDTIVVTFDESIVDARGNKLLPATFEYVVGDNAAPKLVTKLPNTELGGFDNLALEMTFDDVVEGVAGKKVMVYEVGVVAPVATIDAAAFATEDGLYFVAPLTLTGNGDFFVTVEAGAFVDNTATTLGKNFAGIADNTTWTFAVKDMVFCTDNITFAPVDGTSNLPVQGVELKITFCEPVELSNNFVVYIAESSDNTERFSVTTGTLSADGLTLTMKITETLGSATTYAVTVPYGAVTDKAGNPWIGIVDANQWNFTTGDVVAPTVVATPGTGENLPNTFNVSLKFSENVTVPSGAITASAGTVSVTGSGSEYEVTITNATDNATVTLSLGNTIVDAAGNKLTATTFTYKVGDNTAPATTALTPTGNTENANVVLTMTFNEDVVKGTGKLQIFDGSVVAKEFNVTDAAVVVNGKTVSITMPESLKKFTNYFVMVEAGFVKDAAGNKFAGISSPLTWKFTTGDYKTSVDDLAKSIKVYPTVFDNYIRVEASTDVVLTKAVITNIAGQMVKEVVDFDNTIPTSDLRSGVYFISLHTADGIAKTERIIKR